MSNSLKIDDGGLQTKPPPVDRSASAQLAAMAAKQRVRPADGHRPALGERQAGTGAPAAALDRGFEQPTPMLEGRALAFQPGLKLLPVPCARRGAAKNIYGSKRGERVSQPPAGTNSAPDEQPAEGAGGLDHVGCRNGRRRQHVQLQPGLECGDTALQHGSRALEAATVEGSSR